MSILDRLDQVQSLDGRLTAVARGGTLRGIAKQFGISSATVFRILHVVH